MGTEVVGPGGILGWVQGAGSDHWGTSSQALALVECLLLENRTQNPGGLRHPLRVPAIFFGLPYKKWHANGL